MSIEINEKGDRLLEALGDGTELIGRYRGKNYHAKVTLTGAGWRVVHARRHFTSLSAASEFIVGHASNGREFWTVKPRAAVKAA